MREYLALVFLHRTTTNITFELEVLDCAFREGRVSWSKTRAMARVATEQTQAEWVSFAEQTHDA